MAHPYQSNKTLHTDRLSKMLSGIEKESGPKANHADIMGPASVKREMSMHGGKATKLKSGGRAKPKTNININVMPATPDAAAPPAAIPAGLAALAAPKPPMAPPPGPPMGGPPPTGMPPGMPQGLPPGGPMMPHKMGGRAYKKGGAVKDGPAWKEGLRSGTKVQHAGQNDADDINRGPVITRKDGGCVTGKRAAREMASMEKQAKRKAGGRLFSENIKVDKIKNGAGGGKGRLQKIGLYGGK